MDMLLTNVRNSICSKALLVLVLFCFGFLLVFYHHYSERQRFMYLKILSSLRLFCDVNQRFPFSEPCMCKPLDMTMGSHPSQATFTMEQIYFLRSQHAQCALTVNALGRLGNLMGEYSTLYGLAQRNNRPAFMLPEMANVLQRYFNLTIPVLHKGIHEQYLQKVWTPANLNYWMEDSYAHLNETFIMITGYPYSWTYFHHLRRDILKEFTFQPEIIAEAQRKLIDITREHQSVTFIGVHARRGDYVDLMKKPRYQGVVADEAYFQNATAHFRARYPDAVFVVASDDMQWCQKHIDNSRGDVYFMGNAHTEDPIHDLALLANCNHSIITIGTFGFWAAYLAGGETVHLVNYSTLGAPWLEKLKYDKLYLPDWFPIAADLSSRTMHQ